MERVASDKILRLYRGLDRPYRPDHARSDPSGGVNFTDCPYAAVRYAQGRSRVVLVVDTRYDADEDIQPWAPGEPRVREELWALDDRRWHPRRFMIYGAFDALILAVLRARDLRTVVRAKGVVTATDRTKGEILAHTIRGTIGDGMPR